MSIIVGIDPGTNTGYAEVEGGKLITVDTIKLHECLFRLDEHWRQGVLQKVYFEDARLRTWFGNAGREKLQGVGSVKRDCSIIQDFLASRQIPFVAVKPAAAQTKWKADYFAKITGWNGRTSEHSRDAAVLILSRKS